VNVDKKYFFALVLIGLIVIGIVGVVAWNADPAVGTPSVFGHSMGEIDWGQTIAKNVTAAGFCIGTQTPATCVNDWTTLGGGGGGNVTKIINGSGITITPADGTGIVRINATGIIPTRTSDPATPVIGQMWLINP